MSEHFIELTEVRRIPCGNYMNAVPTTSRFRYERIYNIRPCDPAHGTWSPLRIDQFGDLTEIFVEGSDDVYLIVGFYAEIVKQVDAAIDGVDYIYPELRYQAEFDSEYPRMAMCTCGHEYYRHWDDDYDFCTCKYCECSRFIPVKKTVGADQEQET